LNRVFLFIVTTLLAGFFAAIGSIVGHLGGDVALKFGGIIGGLVGVAIAARIAVWRSWIERSDFGATVLAAGIGFLLAAFIALRTLSSPIGPVLSTLLVGIGALLGAGMSAERRRSLRSQ
jgi:hypothetical protein